MGGARGVQMNIKIVDLQSVLQKHEAFAYPYPGPWREAVLCLTYSLPISFSILTPRPLLGKRHK